MGALIWEIWEMNEKWRKTPFLLTQNQPGLKPRVGSTPTFGSL
jgi:hypothetical protein